MLASQKCFEDKQVNQSTNVHGYAKTSTKVGNSPVYTKNGKQYLRLVSSNEVRFLIIPDFEPEQKGHVESMVGNNTTKIVKNVFDQILEKTKRLTSEDKSVLFEKMKLVKDVKVMKVKKKFCKFEVKKEIVDKFYETRLKRERYTLQRANDMLIEESPLMKEFNSKVAERKCIATWDLQIKEKSKRISDEKNEQMKQSNKNEQEMKRFFHIEKERRRVMREENQSSIAALNDQMEVRKKNKNLQEELKREERERFNRAAVQEGRDELQENLRRLKEEELMRQEMRRVNILLQRLQAIDKEEERILTETATETEQRLIHELEVRKLEKREIERKRKEDLMKMAREKATALEKAKFNEFVESSLRMDDTEREWRQRELRETKQKLQKMEAIHLERAKQINATRVTKAREIEEERREVHRIAKENLVDVTKEHEETLKRRAGNDFRRQEILKQINQLERRRMREREEREVECGFFKIDEERSRTREEEKMWQRVDCLRKEGLPDKYLSELENFIRKHYGNL